MKREEKGRNKIVWPYKQSHLIQIKKKKSSKIGNYVNSLNSQQ